MNRLAASLLIACLCVAPALVRAGDDGGAKPAPAAAKSDSKKVVRPPMQPLTEIGYANADGTTETLARYEGKVIVAVNTASECGFTPQYADLEKLYETYKDKGLVVVAFPSNDYGGQEPGTDAEIAKFCSSKYNVTFPVKAKMSTHGDTKSPLYAALTATPLDPGEVKWNFEKFVIDRKGNIVARFRSKTKPMSDEMKGAVEKALKE